MHDFGGFNVPEDWWEKVVLNNDEVAKRAREIRRLVPDEQKEELMKPESEEYKAWVTITHHLKEEAKSDVRSLERMNRVHPTPEQATELGDAYVWLNMLNGKW